MAFDASSGDYWVLDALGHGVLQGLLDGGARSATQLNCGDPAELEPVLVRLRQAGLIQTVHAPAP
ncbi:MAG: PqqD family protein [Comamonadaceae bacterium]|nr:PqqD family protein [Comamonadaceae bacterium]